MKKRDLLLLKNLENIKGKRVSGPKNPFMLCNRCGNFFDARNLKEVFVHEACTLTKEEVPRDEDK